MDTSKHPMYAYFLLARSLCADHLTFFVCRFIYMLHSAFILWYEFIMAHHKTGSCEKAKKK